MKKEMFILSILTAGFITVPSFAVQAQSGCCGPGMGAMSGCSGMSGQATTPAPASAVAENLPQPVATVFTNYVGIQTALAQDSLQDVANEALTIVKAVNNDMTTTFPKDLALQAVAVAGASDLQSARAAFKLLSQSLIEYVSKYPALAGTYRQVHCSMANADWLQTEPTVNNPYMGKAMARCGQFVKSSNSEDSGQQGNSMPGMKM